MFCPWLSTYVDSCGFFISGIAVRFKKDHSLHKTKKLMKTLGILYSKGDKFEHACLRVQRDDEVISTSYEKASELSERTTSVKPDAF